MKSKMAAALVFTMLLCGCGETENEQYNDTSSEKTTTAVTASAEVTTTEAASAVTETTAAVTEAVTSTAAIASATSYEEATSAESTESEAVTVSEELFAGYYLDENGSASLTIDSINDTDYKIYITRKEPDSNTTEWYFTGGFDGRQVLHYDSCIKTLTTAADDGSVSSEKEYSDGTGYLRISEEGTKTGLIWSDDKESAGSGFFFIKQ